MPLESCELVDLCQTRFIRSATSPNVEVTFDDDVDVTVVDFTLVDDQARDVVESTISEYVCFLCHAVDAE